MCKGRVGGYAGALEHAQANHDVASAAVGAVESPGDLLPQRNREALPPPWRQRKSGGPDAHDGEVSEAASAATRKYTPRPPPSLSLMKLDLPQQPQKSDPQKFFSDSTRTPASWAASSEQLDDGSDDGGDEDEDDEDDEGEGEGPEGGEEPGESKRLTRQEPVTTP